MNSVFISIVSTIFSPASLPHFLEKIEQTVHNSFSDFELILLNPYECDERLIDQTLSAFPHLKQSIQTIHFSKKTDSDNAVLAGLDVANGDYVLLFNIQDLEVLPYLSEAYNTLKAKGDILYFKDAHSLSVRLKVFKVFFGFFGLDLALLLYKNKLLSRRAITTLTQFRESSDLMHSTLAYIGYDSHAYPIPDPSFKLRLEKKPTWALAKKSLDILLSFTDFMNILLLWIILFSMVLVAGSSLNAVWVKIYGMDLLGHTQNAVPGWAFLTIFLSAIFAILCLLLYIINFQVSKIYALVKNRPNYIIKQIKK